jgi:hypothetical protein
MALIDNEHDEKVQFLHDTSLGCKEVVEKHAFSWHDTQQRFELIDDPVLLEWKTKLIMSKCPTSRLKEVEDSEQRLAGHSKLGGICIAVT